MKRSLHMGINDYPGSGSDLSGCVNDANDWRAELEARSFQATSLLDSEATKSRMVEEISKIVADTCRDDITVITYSGHGTWVVDDDGDEVDGRDEALCPYDIVTDGHILTDDELYEIFSARKRGARIIFISDSCHSGTVARSCSFMPGTENDDWNFPKIRYLAPDIYLRGDDALHRARRVEAAKVYGRIRAATVLLSGCKDDEYSYDAWFNQRPNGAFTYTALQSLKTLPPNATYRDWHKENRKILPHTQYPQTPQLLGSWKQKSRWKVLQE